MSVNADGRREVLGLVVSAPARYVHVHKDGVDAKFWLFPSVSLAYNYLLEQVETRRDDIERASNDHFGWS